MEITVFDTNINALGVIDEMKSLVWVRRFYTAGTFEIQLPFTENNARLIRKSRILYRSDVKEAVLVKSVFNRRQDGEKYIAASGVSLEGLLDMRTIGINGTASELCALIENELGFGGGNQYITGVPKLRFDFAPDDFYDLWGEELYGKNLGDVASNTLRGHQRGIRIDMLPENDIFLCYIAVPTDRSAGQTENPQVIFSEEFGNLYNTEYNFSAEGCYNYVFAQANVPSDVRVDASRSELTYSIIQKDSDGKELRGLDVSAWYGFVDAVVVDGVEYDDDGNPYTVKKVDYEQTQLALKTACEQHYCPYTENFEGTAVGGGYRRDWQVGDLVTVRDDIGGESYKKQIEEVTEIFDANGKSVTVTFGEPLKTVIDAIKEAGR